MNDWSEFKYVKGQKLDNFKEDEESIWLILRMM